MIGAGIAVYAFAGMYISDRMEEKLGLVPTDKDFTELRNALPKISTVEKKDR